MLVVSLFAALVFTAMIAGMIRRQLPAIRGARQAAVDCPQAREFRFTITETVARWNDGGVVAFPVRTVPARLPQPLRAAA